jgi:hypothetical protein
VGTTLQKRNSRFSNWFPIRFAGVHLCTNDRRTHVVKTLLRLVMGW